jgi:hypothetical protein
VPEKSKLAIREQVTWVECRMDNLRVVVVVRALLDNKNRKFWICLGETSSNYTASEATYETVNLLEFPQNNGELEPFSTSAYNHIHLRQVIGEP